MARQLRQELQAGWHHVTNRGLDRQPVFRSVDDRLDFGRTLGRSAAATGVQVLAYCLMGNHYHLVVSCPDGGLSPFMQRLGSQYTRHANERLGGDGPIFRGRFFSRAIHSEQYLANAVRYVHRNALDMPGVTNVADYRWSSHRAYLGHRRLPTWLSTSPVLDWFESVAGFDAFVSGDRPPISELAVQAGDLFAAVEGAIDELAGSLDRAPQGMMRVACYLVLDVLDPASRDAVVARFGSATADAMARRLRRAQHTAAADPIYARLVERALDLLAPTKLCLTQLGQGSQAGRLAS